MSFQTIIIAGHLGRVYGVPHSRVRIVPRGIDLDRFDPSRVTPDRIVALANRWRLTDGYPVVMLVGELAEEKGQTILVNAIHKLGRRDIRCLLIGSDKVDKAYREGLEALIGRHGLGGVARIIDRCDDMSVAYMLSDVVVSASTEPEAFGRTLIEAQALGRPVIATDHGGPRETVVPGRTGWLTPPGDADALAAAIDTALTLALDSQTHPPGDSNSFERPDSGQAYPRRGQQRPSLHFSSAGATSTLRTPRIRAMHEMLSIFILFPAIRTLRVLRAKPSSHVFPARDKTGGMQHF